jgi:phage terminase large subunit-like protein
LPVDLESLSRRIETATPEQLTPLLAELLATRARLRKDRPLDFFVFKNPKQEAFSRSQKRVRVMIGGNRSGKTEIGTAESSWWAEGRHPFRKVPKNGKGWIISLDFTVQRDILQPKFQKWLSPRRIVDVSHRLRNVWDRIVLTCGICRMPPKRRKQGGASDGGELEEWWCGRCGVQAPTIVFKSIDQGRSKFQGADLDYAWFDEEPPQDIFQEVRARLVDRKGSMWLTFTPIEGGMSWSFDGLYNRKGKDPDLDVIETTTFDNSALDREEVQKWADSITDPAERDIRVYGRYATLSGLIYKEWDAQYNEVDVLPSAFLSEDGTIREGFDTYCGIDTGRCFAATFWVVDFFGNVWGFDEHFSEDASTRANARAIHSICRKWGIWPSFFIDPRTQQDVDLGEEGIPCNKPPDTEVYDGIQVVKNYITARKEMSDHPRIIIVRSGMPGLLWERERYQWAPPAKSGLSAGAPRQQPLKKNDHRLDSGRYVLQTRPQPSTPIDGDPTTREHQIRERIRKKVMERQAEKDGADMDLDDLELTA